MTMVLSASLLYNREWWWLPSIAISVSHWTWKPMSGWLSWAGESRMRDSWPQWRPKVLLASNRESYSLICFISLTGVECSELQRGVLEACSSIALFIWTKPSDNWQPTWNLTAGASAVPEYWVSGLPDNFMLPIIISFVTFTVVKWAYGLLSLQFFTPEVK